VLFLQGEQSHTSCQVCIDAQVANQDYLKEIPAGAAHSLSLAQFVQVCSVYIALHAASSIRTTQLPLAALYGS
jgi:hypothetical protein